MRIKRLDILRCVAVVLVITLHAQILTPVSRAGWAGVDLFFVLSGFLISGLLYSEYKKDRQIDLPRFFIRRGMKIYPAFYVLLVFTLLLQHFGWYGLPKSPVNYVREMIFVQNYQMGLWGHTWSLAVEEHFYLALAVLLAVLARLLPKRPDPFRKIPLICAGAGIVCLLLRALTVYWLCPDPHPRLLVHAVYYNTHTRVDGLFFGVFLGYLYHFRREALQGFLRSYLNRCAVAILSISLLATCYIFSEDTPFFLTFGFSFVYLGFGGVLVLCLEVHDLLTGKFKNLLAHLGAACAYVGKHSYSIYLWHIPFFPVAAVLLRKLVHVQLHGAALAVFNLVGSCALGIALSHLIEFPLLQLRDRVFPVLQPAPEPMPRRKQAYASPAFRVTQLAGPWAVSP